MPDDGWNLADSVIEAATPQTTTTFEFETFYAHRIGFCERQLYLSKLDLTDTRSLQGRFKASRIIADHLGEELAETHPDVNVDVRMSLTTDTIRLIGRCTAHDPETDTVWHLKPRNGWFRYHPPVERHIDQLQVYMAGLGADRGQLIYVNIGDLADVRTWPQADAAAEFIDFDTERFDEVISRAERVKNEIVTNGVACSTTEIPFDRCGCYFCESEDLTLPGSVPAEPTTTSASPKQEDHDQEQDTSLQNQAIADPISLPDGGTATTTISGYHVPANLKSHRVWVLWDGREKVALAPWQEDHMYPARWSARSGKDPRQHFEKAQMVAELPPTEIHRSWPFPNEDVPEEVIPAILLKHDPDNPITVLDFDDVRDPETGTISSEVATLLDRLGAYTEVSRSGTGLHTYIQGSLPADTHSLTIPLRDRGHIECYDRSRFVASTWQHVASTPRDAVPETRSVLESLVATYSA